MATVASEHKMIHRPKIRACRSPGSVTVALAYLILLATILAGCAGSYLCNDNAPLTVEENRASLKALLAVEDFAEYEALPDSLRTEWLRMYWQAHDPTPTTSENEFRIEHLRRVRFSLYYFSNPFGPLPWDDRGEIYIRYGKPDDRTYLSAGGLDVQGNHDLRYTGAQGRSKNMRLLLNGGEDPDSLTGISPGDDPMASRGTEIWNYYRYGQTFQFLDPDGFGVYVLVPLADGISPEQNYGEFMRNRITAVDLQPAIYYHDYGLTHLDYAFDIARFRTPDNLSAYDVDVNLGYPLAELARGGADSSMISLRRSIVVRNDSLREVTSDFSILSRKVGPNDGRQRLMVEQKILHLPPGKYEIAVSIEDLFSGMQGIYKKVFRLPEFVSPDVQEISDIELASHVWSVYEPGSPYVKYDRLVMPLPSRVYLPQQSIAFYYEIYNLKRNNQDTAIYSVEYEILDPEARKVFYYENAGIFYTTERNVSQFGTLEEPRLKPGEYLLSVKVRDENTRKRKRTLKSFKIIKPTE